MVHTPLFDPEALHTKKGYYSIDYIDGNIRNLIAIHRAKPVLMRELQSIVERYPVDNLLAEITY